MVLQTNHEYGARSFLFGEAAAGEVVEVDCFGKYTTTASSDGKWDVQLNPHGVDGKGTTCTITGASNTITIKEARFGDVYLCSGQSNMEFPLKLTLNASTEIATLSELKNLRTLSVTHATADSPQTTFNSSGWVVPDSTSIGEFSAVCFMTVRDIARIKKNEGNPIGLIQTTWGGTRVEAWMSPDALKACPYTPPTRTDQNAASALWNAMVTPLRGYSIRAALWYQGEANADEPDTADEYSCFFGQMINSWRNAWALGDFPFLYMQLPPSLNASAPKFSVTGRQAIREAQQMVLPHPQGPVDTTGMAVTIDLGGKSAWGWNHPPNKNEMSHRLALSAMHTIYALQPPFVNFSGPTLESATSSAGTVTLSFNEDDYAAIGLALMPSSGCNACCGWSGDPTTTGSPFEVSSDGGKTWQPANATKVTVSPPSISLTSGASSVSHVRYAWTDFVQCVIKNDAGLVTGPFMTATDSSSNTASTLASPPVEVVAAPVKTSSLPGPPALGFNSWNAFHNNVNENLLIDTARLFVSTGLQKVGFTYVNIDDGWQAEERLPNGTIRVDPVRFPSGFKWLSAQLHSMGLKFGIYTARATYTCQGRPGSYQHEEIDAATYCDWDLDYLKIDKCGGPHWPQENTTWIKFHDAFQQCAASTGRPIYESVESCGTVTGCGEWIGAIANSWRIGGDIQATWASIMSIIDHDNTLWSIAGPGNINDADMLQVGDVGLSLTESRTHYALWCILTSPLLIGTDLSLASPETLEIFTAAEYVQVNQDPLVSQGRRVAMSTAANGTDYTHKTSYNSTDNVSNGVREVWAKQLMDGSGAVLLLNRDDTAVVEVTVELNDVPGFTSSDKVIVRDLWAKKDIATVTGSYTAKGIDPHSHVFLSIRKA